MNLLHQFKQNWLAKKFCLPDGSILVSVSGGIDSMVLADLFLKSGMQFSVAHCNFQLRGEAADQDERFVALWCSLHKIQLHSTRFDTHERSEEWKKGIQETARILRYEWFEQIRKENNYAKIATAHHANDNAETMLMNLFKGTGISGIHGILPDQNKIIRPLLFAQKQDILFYAAGNNVIHREDASNASDDYLRNALRHNIVPAILELFPNAIQSLNDSIGRFAEAEILYKKAIQSELKKLVEQRGQDFYIPILKLQKCSPIATICYELIHPYGFSPAQVEQVLNLLLSESGHYTQSATHRIIRNRDFLVITTLPSQTTDLILVEAVPFTVDTAKYRFSFSIIDKPKEIDTNPDIALIDMKHIEFPLILRKWKTGDYFYPLGMQMKKKKVSKVLINEKVALHEKENTWVVECDKRITWLAGIRLDERFKIKESTEKVLLVKKVAI
jgi:tRNA(Ile)-lysidine synthase